MQPFRRMILTSSFLWIVSLSALLYLQVFHPIIRENSSKYTKNRYSKKGKLPESIFQYRTGVSKDLWITSGDKRIYCHLESPSSSLQFTPDLTETLSSFKVWIKEPSQDVRYFKADQGIFNYSTQRLTSLNAFFSTANFSCLLKNLDLSFHSTPPSFTASQFSATLTSGDIR